MIADVNTLVSKVKELAEQHPKVMYHRGLNTGPGSQCYYYPDAANPHGCLIGFAAREIGRSLDRSEQAGILDYVIFNDVVTPEAEWLNAVQNHQDNGNPWMECIQYADDYMKDDENAN